MKQKTRLLALSVALTMCVGSIGIAACGEKPVETHLIHVSAGWETDENNHWKICTECGVKFSEGAHSYSKGKCICGKVDPNAPPEEDLPPPPVDDTPVDYDPAVDDQATEGLAYTEMKDESGEVIGYRVGPGDDYDMATSELYIPQRHNGLPVLCIGMDLDTYQQLAESGISEVELKAAYKENGFYENQFLKTVHMGREVKYIGPCAFTLCSILESVEFAERLESIESQAFAACYGLKSLDLSSTRCTKIGFHAFDACTSLETAVLSDTVRTLDDGAFVSTVAMKEITVGKRLATIGANVFYGCTSLTNIELPDSLQSIGESAFQGSGLVSIDFGNGVGTIGAKAFLQCAMLEEVNLPDSVYEIGELSFGECMSSEVEGVSEATGLKRVTIGTGLEEIPEKAFHFNGLIESVVLKGVKRICSGAFEADNGMTSIDFGDKLEIIESSAFWSCTALKEIVFPDSIYTIGKAAFQMCTGLETITLGKNLSVIQELAFDRCTNIKKVIYNGTYEDWQFVNTNNAIKTPDEFLGK